MRISKFLGALAASLMICGAASAATVRVDLNATVDFIEGFTTTPFQLGQKVSASFTYDDSQSPVSSSGTRISYPQMGGSISFPALGYYDVIEPTPGFPSLSLSNSEMRLSGWGGGRAFGVTINVSLQPAANPYNIGQLATALSQPDFQTGKNFIYLQFVGSGFWGDCPTCSVGIPLDSITVTRLAAVPVPAALPLMALGLVGLGLVGRRRHG